MPIAIPVRATLFGLLFCLTIITRAQTGNYFLSHYLPTEERFDYVCFEMVQDTKGVMYFATKAGILEFSGRDWDLLPASSAIYSIQTNAAGDIYWAGAKGFGKIGLDKHGFQQFQFLSDSTVTDAFQCLAVKDLVYFLTDEAVYEFNPRTKELHTIQAPPNVSLLKLFEIFGVVHVNTDEGLYKIDHSKLTSSKLNINGQVVFFSRIDDTYILGTDDNKIYSCSENLSIRPINLQDQAYIEASVIVGGSWLNRQLLALGTLRGGVIFVNPINGLTQEIINYATGLPDNEVFELMTDVNENVWVGHDYGFTKISPYVPLRSFNHYSGLQGNLLCAYSSQSSVYVGTSLGLFKLEKFDLYDELVYYEDVLVREPRKSTGKKQSEPVKEPVKDESKPVVESKKGGLFSFLKRNRKEKAAEAKPDDKVTGKSSETPVAKEEQTIAAPAYRRVKRTQKILRSSQYTYKKVQGIDAKVTHLAEVQGKLIASGLGGLYEVSNLQSRVLMEEPIRFIYAPQNRDIIIVSTYEDEVRALRLTGKVLESQSIFNSLDDQIHFAFEGNGEELWLCGIDKIYRAQLEGSEVRHKQTFNLIKRNTDKTVGTVWNDAIVLTNGDGFFKVDREKGVIQELDTLPKPSQYFAYNGGILYRDQHGWSFLSAESKENNLQLLNVFNDLRFITSDKKPENLWLISGENELYKFFGDKVVPLANEFPLYLKSISNQDRVIVNRNEISMDQEHSSVRFEVVQPDYINPQGIEFRYMLKGMQSNWSEWSNNNNIIDFPYLPTGEYTLQVQSKNIFGKTSELEPLSFEVLPPYWKRSWFYAMEFAVFASLVVLSFRLSTRYRIISRLLSLLTIILLIEFIQTVIGATISFKGSPVIDFFIQVVVALLVLPVEGYLRNLMLRSLDSSGKFYQFIVPKEKEQETGKFIKVEDE